MTAPSSLPAFGRTTGQTFESSSPVPRSETLATQAELGAQAMPMALAEGLPALTLLARAALFIVGEGLSVGLFLWALFSGPSTTPYSVDNQLPIDERRVLVGIMLGLAGLGLCAGLFVSLRHGQRGRVRTLQVAARLSPLMLLGLLPFLLRWQLWQTRELTLAVLAGVYGLGAYAAFLTALRAPPLFSASFADYARRATARQLARLRPFLPATLVVLGVLGYSAFFSYYTLQNHRNLLTASFDLGLENNLMWNVVNGGPFMKSSPLGPGSHFGFHATLFAYLIAPFYYFAQRPETLLVFQSAMIGAAALPLYGFAKRHIGRWGAAIVAFLYLFYPPVHGANLYDFHYLPLGVFFLWLVLYLVEAGRFKLAALAVVVTLSIREDVAASLIVVGAYLVLAGTRPRAGMIVAAVSAAYFVLMKMIIMPRFHGGESFLHQWQGLAPEGAKSYGGVLMTVLANPVFTLTSLLEPEKYLYIAQIAAPLCFFPWRRPIGYFLSFPGFFFTLLSTKYLPLVQISFQYTAHWSAFLFIAVVANLAYLRKATFRGDSTGTGRYRASLAAIALATLVCSYQYGAVLQQNTARGGFGPYKFTSTEADRKRFTDLQSLIAKVPPMAKIVSSENIVPHVSSRPDSYTLRVGNFDADYMLFSTPVWGEELANVNKALNGDFGVVEIRGDFALAKRGHPKDQNSKALRRSR
jgi:uncharacterized membrane protein